MQLQACVWTQWCTYFFQQTFSNNAVKGHWEGGRKTKLMFPTVQNAHVTVGTRKTSFQTVLKWWPFEQQWNSSQLKPCVYSFLLNVGSNDNIRMRY